MQFGKPLRYLCMLMSVLLFCSSALAERTVQEDVQYTVDFAYIDSFAPGSVGWIYQPHSTINQPLMYSSDSTYFLHHRYTGRSHRNGAIFMTGETSPDFSAPVITLYGNNCYDNTLFGSLSLYKDPEYYLQNPTFYLITPQGEYRLDVFAGLRINRRDDSWQISEPSAEQLKTILQSSFIVPDVDFLPQEDDSWAVLATIPVDDQVNRYVLYARKRRITYDQPTVYDMNRQEMDLRQTQNGRVTVDGVGSWMVYAQDDPLWDRLIFEATTSPKRRVFGDGGCGPTAVAIALASILDGEELTQIGKLSNMPYGYRFCSCSVTEDFCSGLHLPYQLSTPEQFVRYFPLAVASFSTGNNSLDVRGRNSGYGTNMSYLQPLCEAMGVSCVKTNSQSEAVDFLRDEGHIIVTCTAGASSPFTDTSHFLVMAGVDDEYLYLIDPMRRDDYSRWDEMGIVEIVAPGVVRVQLKYVDYCNLGPFFQLKKFDPAVLPKPGSTLTLNQ